MIEFKNEGTKVTILIDSGVNVEKPGLLLYWECESELFARLLMEQLRDKFSNTVETIRKEEYLRGYKDKQQRKPKQDDWFPVVFKRFW